LIRDILFPFFSRLQNIAETDKTPELSRQIPETIQSAAQ
jgi:hypothetical protein